MQKKLHAELIRTFDVTEPRVLTFEEVQNRSCAYLDAVVAEILRLAHVAPVVARQSKSSLHFAFDCSSDLGHSQTRHIRPTSLHSKGYPNHALNGLRQYPRYGQQC